IEERHIGWDVMSAVYQVIDANAEMSEDGGYKDYDFTDKALPAPQNWLKVSSKGVSKVTADTLDFSKPNLVAGQSLKSSSNTSDKAVFTVDKDALATVTILKDSSFEQKNDSKMDITVATAGTYDTAKFNGSQSGTEQYVLGFTAKSAGKSAKITLTAKFVGSANFTNQTSAEVGAASSEEYSGSLIVYGADNAVVYKLEITDKTTYTKALGYFN
ncbi:MAG: hypothetical protein LBD29_04570, partial [Treponema sp.]|nr:hypothetical protein [Treponema sp.]